ncbi:MAG: TonB-dependent receptor [Woeseiaceae bacterium]|nr:TonB-dependent receptor [Woeseiaceae bacterium]
MKSLPGFLATLVAAIGGTAPMPASHAQDPDEDALALDEVVTSARKRDEFLQSVPIAVSVFSGERLEQLAIDNVENLARFAPSLYFDEGVLPMDTRPVIRGVSTLRGRPNVGVLVDFVDVSSESLTVAGGGITTNLRLLDLERVEIVKGPQSTLYGRSAFSGAINYVTRRPNDAFASDVRVSFDDQSTTDIRLTAGGPLIDDKLGARVVFSKYDSDGYYTNPNTGGKLGAVDSVGGALGLEWEITDRTSAYFRVEHSNDEQSPRAEVHVSSLTPESDPANFIGTGAVTEDAVMFPHTGFGTTVCNTIDRIQPYYDSFGIPGAPPCRPLLVGELSADESMIDLSADPRTSRDFLGSDIDTTRYHLDINVDFELADFTYILGYLDNQAFVQQDFDKNDRMIFSSFVPFPPPGSATSQYGLSSMSQQSIDTRQVNHEFRLSGESDRTAWLLSLLHWEEDMNLQFDDEWWLREGGDAGAVLDVLNASVFSYLSQPVGPFPDFCALMYPGNPACIPAVTSLQDSIGNTPAVPITRETRHTSIAGLARIDLTENLVLTLEGRLLTESIDYSGEASDISLSGQFGNDPWWGSMFRTGEMTYNTVEEDAFVPKVTLDWSASDSLLLYGYYSQAFKPGGIATTDVNGDVRDGEYKSEKLEAYELGFKSDFRRGSIRWNGAVFYYDYTDQQVPFNFLSPTTGRFQTSIVNAGETEITGFETDLVWNSALVDGLSVRLSYTFTDAEFTNFNLNEILAPAGGSASTFNRAKAGNEDGDFSGKVPPLTPENAATASVRYESNLSPEMTTFVELFAKYQDERFISEGNRSWLPSYTLLDLYAGVARGQWSLMLYVQNLDDDDKIKSGLTNVDFTLLPDGRSLPQAVQLYLPQPRTIGARLQVSFGD